MQIISHRGYWKTDTEKNLPIAFERSFSLGFGTETDFRDAAGKLVISHDMPREADDSVNEFINLYKKHDASLPLALNIKADGLQKSIKRLIEQNEIKNYFVFDMSVPDTLGYIKEGIIFFTRQSEYEPQPSFYKECNGIWLDAFTDTWYNAGLIKKHTDNNKKVAIVSPELHKRAHLHFWEEIKNKQVHLNELVILCTDVPEAAKLFFYGN